MTDHDHDAIASKIVSKMQAAGCQTTGICPTFDKETVTAIRNCAQSYGRLCNLAWWSGAILAGTALTALATGLCLALWEGFKHGIKAGG